MKVASINSDRNVETLSHRQNQQLATNNGQQITDNRKPKTDKKVKSYNDLDIYNLAFDYAIEVHRLTMKLPKHELYEQGSQLRRSSKSIKDNIIEGYGRKAYKSDFIKFLIYAYASLLECKSQLEMINQLYPDLEVESMIKKYDELGAKIYKFTNYVEENWKTKK